MFRKNGLPPLQLNKQNVRGTVMAYLIFFLVATLMFTGISYARYTSSARGTATASVAAFDISISKAASGNLSINSNKTSSGYNHTASTTFTVSSGKTQVTTNYSVIVKNVPSQVKPTIDGTTGSQSGTTWTFSNSNMTFAPSANTSRTHTLTFDASAYTGSSGANQAISIEVVAVQKD